MVVNAKCNPCKEPTKYVAGFFGSDQEAGVDACLIAKMSSARFIK